MTAIETVTVTFEEMQHDPEGYMRLRKTNRLVITHAGKEILVLGPWLPGEERTPAPDWLLSELHPRAPIHPGDPNFDQKFWEYVREHTTST